MKKLAQVIFFVSFFLINLSNIVMAKDESARLMRTPDYHNGKVVFVYQEDLWTVDEKGGTASRLTVHDGKEQFPKFSPDGKWIAFTGNYNGSNSVFIMPSQGGEPKQLTYYPDYSTMVIGWTPDSQKVLFVSNRKSSTWCYNKIFEIDIKGGLPCSLNIDKGSFASYSPDGTKIVFNNHPEYHWWWKRYKGSFNQDVWLYDKGKNKFLRLTDYEGNDTWPMWGLDDKIYFVSDRNDIANIYSYSLKDKAIKQITKHNIDGVKWASMGSDRKNIVYECDGRLFKLDTSNAKVNEIVVYASCDDHYDMVEYFNPSHFIRAFDVSPTGKRIVFEARGDIFTAPVEHGDIRNLTKSSSSRDRYPTWSRDGKYIAYISDATGDDEIYIAHQLQKETPVKLTDDKNFKFNPKWSPDSKKILYTTHDHHLLYLDISNKQVKSIAQDKFYRIYGYNWSPDNKWITYQLNNRNYYNDIYIYSLETNKSVKITNAPSFYSDPQFTPDGEKLIFLASENNGWYSFRQNEGYGLFGAYIPTPTKILSVTLIEEKEEPYEKVQDEEPIEGEVDKQKDDKTESEDKDDVSKGKDSKKAKKDDKKEIKVEIDFKDISSRIRTVPVDPGPYGDLQVTDKYYYYVKTDYNELLESDEEEQWWQDTTPQSLYSYDVEKQKTKEILHGIRKYTLSFNGEKILTWNNKNFQVFDVGEEPDAKKSIVKLDKLSIKLDRRAEWEQIFNECSRVVRDYFYDPNIHGVDWNKVKNYYANLLPYVKTREDLNILLTEMVGELNASHQGVSGGDWPEQNWYNVGLLGAELIPDYKAGYYKFTKIYKGDKSNKRYRAPLDNEFVKIKVGDYLLAINGEIVKAEDDYYKFLVNEVNKKITLTTNSKPTMNGAIESKIKPVYSEMSLRYKEWLDKNNDFVEKTSSRKIGYMHLQDMGGQGLDAFDKFFQANNDKEGLIIDVRYNGGGGIDSILIDKLERIAYMTGKTRYGESQMWPTNVFAGKIVVLINEYSFSDAEIFPRAFQIRKLGKVIGVPTLGYCIAVTEHKLIDDGRIRKTFVGIWDLEGQMIESKGVQPDIYVENTHESELAGKDLQLEKATDYLMEEIKKSPRQYNYPQKTPAR